MRVSRWRVTIRFQIPPLSLQTLVENAVRHGILKRRNGGTICIRITDSGEYYKLEIIDNGVGMGQEKIQQILSDHPTYSGGGGLSNTNRRLKKLFGIGLKIESESNSGTTVSFQIPK